MPGTRAGSGDLGLRPLPRSASLYLRTVRAEIWEVPSELGERAVSRVQEIRGDYPRAVDEPPCLKGARRGKRQRSAHFRPGSGRVTWPNTNVSLLAPTGHGRGPHLLPTLFRAGLGRARHRRRPAAAGQGLRSPCRPRWSLGCGSSDLDLGQRRCQRPDRPDPRQTTPRSQYALIVFSDPLNAPELTLVASVGYTDDEVVDKPVIGFSRRNW